MVGKRVPGVLGRMGCGCAGKRGVYSDRDEENDIKSRHSGRITDVR